MKIAHFKRLLAAYGPDLKSWPVAQINAAETLLQSSPQAVTCLKDELALDAILERGLCYPDRADAAADRVMARAFGRIEAVRDQPAQHNHRAGFWLQKAGFASAGLLLFLMGIGYGSLHFTSDTRRDTAATLILDGPYRSFASL
jgi:hypothetical protein